MTVTQFLKWSTDFPGESFLPYFQAATTANKLNTLSFVVLKLQLKLSVFLREASNPRCIKMFPFFYFFFVLFFTFLFLKNDTKKWKMFWDSLLYGAIEMANRRPMQMLSWLLRGLQRRRPQTGVQNSWRVSLHCGQELF